MSKAPAKRHRKGDGRVAFLAKKALFRSLLEAGHPQRSIYDDHGVDLGISYSQFNRYVNKYLLAQKESTDEHQKESGTGRHSPVPAGRGTDSKSEGSASAQHKPQSAGKPSGGFEHNPSAGNDRDDLI